MSYKNIPLKVKPSPEDKRDYSVSRLIAKVNVFPEEFEIPYKHDILNQGLVGSCVGFSLEGYCRSITEEKQSGKYQYFSPGFRYGLREPIDYQGEGMIPREALESSRKYGSIPYSKFPFNEEYLVVKEKIEKDKINLLKIAEPYKISSYCRLYSVDDIKNALMLIGMVTICIPIYSSFYDAGEDGIVKNPSNNETLWGYHMMTIYGWRKDNKWKVLNSWSEFFGDRGRCYLDFNFPIVEAWSISDTILPHPEPINPQYWRVQCGAFKVPNNCKRLADELKTKGFSTYIVFGKDSFYRVQCGAFAVKQNAINLEQKLKSMGYSTWLINY